VADVVSRLSLTPPQEKKWHWRKFIPRFLCFPLLMIPPPRLYTHLSPVPLLNCKTPVTSEQIITSFAFGGFISLIRSALRYASVAWSQNTRSIFSLCQEDFFTVYFFINVSENRFSFSPISDTVGLHAETASVV
jgi:hypothetical protein